MKDQSSPRRVGDKERTARELTYLEAVGKREQEFQQYIETAQKIKQSTRQQPSKTIRKSVRQQHYQPVVHARLQQRRQPVIQRNKKGDLLPAIIVCGLLIIALLVVNIISALLSLPASPTNNFVPDPTIYASPTNIYEPGSTIYTSPATTTTDAFCTTHTCIPNYPNGKGSIIECRDGAYSHSGGRRGACSYH